MKSGRSLGIRTAATCTAGSLTLFGRERSVLLLAVLAALSVGCAGTRYEVTAKDARYPISMSPALKDDQEKTVFLEHELESKGSFTFSTTKFGFFYSMVGRDLDISELINREVGNRRGEGVASLLVTTEECGLNWFLVLSMLPFWPGCQHVDVTGVVVARKAASPIPAAERGILP